MTSSGGALWSAAAGVASAPIAAQLLQDGPEGIHLLRGVSAGTETNLVLSLIVIAVLIVARRAILVVVGRRVGDTATRYRWAKGTATAAFFVAGLVLFQIWFVAIRSLGTFLGLASAGLAIALKDPITDIAGWLVIVWKKPFDVGDRIQIGEFKGDVVDRRVLQFTIMEIGNWVAADQSTGRLIHIPNAMLFREPLANYTSDFPYLWNELRVMVTFESDWRKAKTVLEELAGEFSVELTKEAMAPAPPSRTRFLIHFRKLTPVVYVSVEPNGVLLTLRYLCRPRERRGTAGQLWERILTAFAEEPDITFAYPTQRITVGAERLATPSDAPAIDGSARGV